MKTFAYVAATGCGLKAFCGNSAIGAILPEPATGAGYIHLNTSKFSELKNNNDTLRLGFTAISGNSDRSKPVNTRYYPLLITRLSPGNFAVVDSNCTHSSWMVRQEGGALRCPVHGSMFQFDGSRVSGPASGPLKTYKHIWQPASGDDGTLSVEVPRLGYSVELGPVDSESETLELGFLARQSVPYQVMFRDAMTEQWTPVMHATSAGQTPSNMTFTRTLSDSNVKVYVSKPESQGFFLISNVLSRV